MTGGDTTGTGAQLERAQQWGYSAEVIYSSSVQDNDSEDEKAWQGRDGRGGQQKQSKTEIISRG